MTPEEFQNLYDDKIKPIKEFLFSESVAEIKNHNYIYAKNSHKLFQEFLNTLKLGQDEIIDLIKTYKIQLELHLKG